MHEDVPEVVATDTHPEWIAAAERDVRATARPYNLVPTDHPARAWDQDAAANLEHLGQDVAKAGRLAAAAILNTAREQRDHTTEHRAELWRRELGRTAAGPKYGPKPPERWFTVAGMVAAAVNDWLTSDIVTEQHHRNIDTIRQLQTKRNEAIDAAFQQALNEAIVAETQRRTSTEAWQDELAQRLQDAEAIAAAEQANAALDLLRGSLMTTLDAPERYEVLEPYQIDHDGVWLVRTTEKGDPQRTRIAYGPLIVRAVFVDPAGEQMLELAWLDGNLRMVRTIPRSAAKAGEQLIRLLGDANLPIVKADARQVERYLAAVEADNRAVIPRIQLARQLGWQPDGQFVTAQDSPLRVEPLYREQRNALAAHRPLGDLAEWQSIVKLLEPYPIPRAILAAGFAAPLLELLRLDSFTVDLSGRSTGGKTVSAMVAFSIWGCPTEQGGGIQSWRTTMLAAEKRLNLANGVPVVFDETRSVKDEGLVDRVLYQIPMNRGTSRGGDYPSDLPWKTVLISTGEQPALSFTTHEGASARILSLRGAPFGRNGRQSENAAREVGSRIGEQFGTAGPAFIARLQEELAEPGGLERLRLRHRELADEHRTGPAVSDVSKRRAIRVAVVRLAEELAYEWSVSPLPALTSTQWTDLLSVEQERDDRGVMALDIAREFVARQVNRMWTPNTMPDSEPTLGWIGAYLEVETEPGVVARTVALLPGPLTEELRRRNYQIEAVRQAWVEAKLITLDATGQLVRRRAPKRVRVYEFSRTVFDDIEDDGPDEKAAGRAEPSAGGGDSCSDCGHPYGSIGHSANCESGHE